MRHTKCSGLVEAVLEDTIPMHGRMIHGRDKAGGLYQESQEYDVHGRFIRAVDRAGLNKRLLDELERLPNVKLCFNHKLTGADFKKNIAWFEQRKSSPKTDNPTNPTETDTDTDTNTSKPGIQRETEISTPFDFLIGADGAHSAARFHLMKFSRMDYQQEYIDTLWCEFQIPPLPTSEGGGFRLSPNHLHIWPGGEFMFIAIPSLDHSFTCTLFLPEQHFSEISNSPPSSLLNFFNTNFPGVVPDLITSENVQQQFTSNPHLPLISIKCTPYHYGSSVVILGDAAHAMVPFYGQGMNAGLEDVRVLFEILERHIPSGTQAQDPETGKIARAAALAEYTKQRTPDAATINDLALRNYTEMRSSVRSPLYRVRKFVEETVDRYLPSLGWQTQYSRISFGNERYSDVEKAVQRQSRSLIGIMGLSLGLAIGVAGFQWWKWKNARARPGYLSSWLLFLAKKTEVLERTWK
ncbi:MAG: hypothetical protein M1812_006989 [Candelaria pacifica]|nr:MAG: hypothetical protein M1812_006989 [Candelaria pacifica]